jgi:glucose/arabinose dehydrogenase
VPNVRELAVAPNGDLLAGTLGREIVVLADAQGTPHPPATFVRADDAPASGIALASDALYVGTQFGVWKVPYRTGDRKARESLKRIASIRPSGIASDHNTTSLALDGEQLYASVGSSCDACDPELDATRATVQEMGLDGNGMHPKAIHIRNAIALAIDPATHVLWAGVAGQDELANGHPYEIFDPVGAHAGTVDYGWPHCYENRRAVKPGADCTHQIVPRVVFPAYETPIGAAFYPLHPTGRFAFPPAYRGAAFVTLHGSWHQPLVPPRVVFVPLDGDNPRKPVDWGDPHVQWRDFLSGFQASDGGRIGRPTGIAVGTDGSLFVADDSAGAIYRIRPTR